MAKVKTSLLTYPPDFLYWCSQRIWISNIFTGKVAKCFTAQFLLLKGIKEIISKKCTSSLVKKKRLLIVLSCIFKFLLNLDNNLKKCNICVFGLKALKNDVSSLTMSCCAVLHNTKSNKVLMPKWQIWTNLFSIPGYTHEKGNMQHTRLSFDCFPQETESLFHYKTVVSSVVPHFPWIFHTNYKIHTTWHIF